MRVESTRLGTRRRVASLAAGVGSRIVLDGLPSMDSTGCTSGGVSSPIPNFKIQLSTPPSSTASETFRATFTRSAASRIPTASTTPGLRRR